MSIYIRLYAYYPDFSLIGPYFQSFRLIPCNNNKIINCKQIFMQLFQRKYKKLLIAERSLF